MTSRKVLLPLEITLLSNERIPEADDTPVLLPLEITLLSNATVRAATSASVLLPLEITLLSNEIATGDKEGIVLLPLEITLLSNLKSRNEAIIGAFRYYKTVESQGQFYNTIFQERTQRSLSITITYSSFRGASV